MWSGSLRVGLFNVPVTIGKSWSEDREKNLRDICATHLVPVDRSERCGCGTDCALHKVKGVETASGWRALEPNEYARIEAATKSDTLEIIDVQPLGELPLMYATGTYYLRADKKAKGPVKEMFATLALAMAKSGLGMVVKWSSSSRQRFGILHTYKGMILMTTIPSETEVRLPGEQERLHFSATTKAEEIDTLAEILSLSRDAEGFSMSKLVDNGLALRTAAVEKILAGENGENGEKAPEVDPEPEVDIMSILRASMTQMAEPSA